MRTNDFTLKSILKALAGVASILCLTAAVGFGQAQVVNLTAGETNLTLPDGTTVPMWGYSCRKVDTSSTATCAKLNPNAAGWSPVVITVPQGDELQINLTNNLAVPTSLTIVGQIGGGLGTVGSDCKAGGTTCTTSPTHGTQGVTWPIAGGTSSSEPTFTPPSQGPRVQSFGTEAAANGGTATLTWQNIPQTNTSLPLQDGTYLLETGTHPSIQAPMGLYGMVVVTKAPTSNSTTGAESAPGMAYPATGSIPAVMYDAAVNLLFSEIDPVQNNEVQTAVHTSGFSATAVWSGKSGACGDPAVHTCYPPAVNYVPLYFLINGVAFDKTHASASVFPVLPAITLPTVTTPGSVPTYPGKILVRMVNAGLRMHVPSIVGSQTTEMIKTLRTTHPSGFSLIAEDGNLLPGVPRVQSEVFMAAGKTYDVLIDVPAGNTALPVYDRALSLSGDKTERDAGMIAYIAVHGESLPSAPELASAEANPDTYSSVVSCSSAPCNTVVVSDPSKGVLANDINVYGVQVATKPANGTLNLAADGTFTYTPNPGVSSDSFEYCGNGTTLGATGAVCAKVTLGAATIEGAGGIAMNNITFNAATSTYLNISAPGPLAVDADGKGYPLTLDVSTVTGSTCDTLHVQPDGGFIATSSGAGSCSFVYKAKNSQGTQSSDTATVLINFPTASGLTVNVVDGKDKATQITDYRWIIEEDRTFHIDPNNTTNTTTGIAPVFGTNFHTSYMPVVAEGCTGDVSCESGQTIVVPGTTNHVAAVCDEGDGVCDTSRSKEVAIDPSQVHLDPNKRYYISVLPGDASDPFNSGYAGPPDCSSTGISDGKCGHGMGGAPIAAGQTNVTVLVERTPFHTAKLAVQVFEDDFPLNGEQDAGGGIDVLATNEPGLGGFNIELYDDAGGTGDATGQITYDMFNMPLSNSLSGQIDPATGLDACPISQQATTDPTQVGITGQVVTCPRFESDGKTLSPLAGQAVIANLYTGRYGVVATPGADRIARGEEWLQTNTLDGQKAHDSFLRVGEPAYFQEYGPAGYHVSIGFANPKIINDRLKPICAGTDQNLTGTNCNNSVTGKITDLHVSRTPDERVYSTGSYKAFSFTQCYVSVGDPDGEDFAFTKCNPDGTFKLSNLPEGTWRVTVFDQWNDLLVDGLSTPVKLGGGNTAPLGDIATNQWHADLYTSTYFDKNGDGVREAGEPGLSMVSTNIRFRDGSYSNFNSTDFNGYASFNEEFPLFNWYVVETDSTRFKNTGTHVVYDAGGPVDGSLSCGNGTDYPKCGSSTIGDHLANTFEQASVPTPLRVPGSVYCDNADCNGFSILNGPSSSASSNLSTGRIDPPWVLSEGWQGFSGQSSFIEFGKEPYAPGENGGIHGHVVYASTRPFDDPQLNLQLSWEPLVPHVTMNLYQVGTAPDGSVSLTKVDTTETSSWDDWAQGFRRDSSGKIVTADGGAVPNMSCPGQSQSDLFYYSLKNQPMYLDQYYNPTSYQTVADNSQFKCYDAMHNWNQLQPAPYDGYYQFPSVTSRDPVTGKPTGTNCTICNPDHAAATTDWGYGAPMLPPGKYVVEMIVPQGYELVKEEDKNILLGDNFIAPVTQEFAGLGNIFILPDQAEVGDSYNGYNNLNPTQDLGVNAFPTHEGDTGSVEEFWPCVGQARIVPDYVSLFPQSQEVSPFAGATRHLCDRKEVTVSDQRSSLAKFYIFSSTHVAAHYTGIITDDFTSEFDPFSPVFGEKFSPPNMPISIKDFAGNEVSRTYSDQWGAYDGLTYSTWEVNPPNPTGYGPQVMVTCMNDKTKADGTTDPLFNPDYSQFCYETPFMPGQTQYMDTPVVPTSAFVGAGYNNPDCNYPDATPAIKEVDGDLGPGGGPWVSGPGSTLTITALGKQTVSNYGYSGPSATSNPFNEKTIQRTYSFGTTPGTVTIIGSDGVAHSLTNVSWGDMQITGDVPDGVPDCAIQQQAQYGGPADPANNAKCGELVITAANGKKSIDTVTVTIGGKKPTVMASGETIQAAIDKAEPGDMIIVPPGTYKELLIMWKPVRLQGVGAASSIIDGNTHPAGKLDDWRRRVDCLFGLALNGQPIGDKNPFDSSGAFTCGGWTDFSGGPNYPNMVVDRIPLEGILGWDTTVNGNLAEMLQEPSLMGAYEGAAITVLSKGVNIPANSTDVFGSGAEAGFPTGTTLLTAADCTDSQNNNPYPSNFQCNPSSIDGLGITDSSQGGGGIYVHGWAHNLQIANNRVFNNAGTLSGGITIGQGEFPGAYLFPDTTHSPSSCATGPFPTNTQLPYCFNLNVNVHNNMITSNSSTGDELFSATPAGAGGVSFCTGADYYKFNYNWVCGNLSTGDGGGVGQLGFAYNGDIEHNTFLFNQSQNPTIPTNGGGLIIMGAPPDGFVNGVECGSVTDQDCKPGLGDGAGPGLVVNANLFMGNSAESGSGGALRFQAVNGTDVARFPNPGTCSSQADCKWYMATVTNNIIANNVAGWDGAGVSLEDSLVVNLVNNTIMSNDTTASAGPLFNTLGAPLASSQTPPTPTNNGTTSSLPQPAGLVSMQNSPQLMSSLVTETITCPAGHYEGSTAPNGSCVKFSYPILYNNVFWQNRAFYVGVGGTPDATYQQNVVTLYDAFTATPAPSQPSADATQANGGGTIITGGTGACTSNLTNYWDIGVRGDTGPSDHSSGITLSPAYSILTDAADYPNLDNSASDPTVLSQYCNGARIPPEFGGSGYQVPPGVSDATMPNPIFRLQPSATVDEGNNWVNLSWGPLSLTNPVTGTTLGNYSLAPASPAINYITCSTTSGGCQEDTPTDTSLPVITAPTTDFFGNPRPDTGGKIDAGAVEVPNN